MAGTKVLLLAGPDLQSLFVEWLQCTTLAALPRLAPSPPPPAFHLPCRSRVLSTLHCQSSNRSQFDFVSTLWRITDFGGGPSSMHSVAIRAPWEGACTSLANSRNRSNPRRAAAPFVVRCGVAEPSGKPAPFGQITRYNDNLLDKAFMALFRRKMEQFTGKTTPLTGYEGFVDVSKKIMQGRTAVEQRAIVRNVLLSLLPPGAPAQFRKLFPPTKWSAEFNAAITVPFFQWLVGPAELMEIEVDGVKQMSGVKITKCRYLENSGCVGMCVNMCKIPTQDFFTNEFGLPLTMTPNFEDMSCEMFYGQMPPPIAEDPALQQPCFATMCSIAPPKSTACPKLQQVAQVFHSQRFK